MKSTLKFIPWVFLLVTLLVFGSVLLTPSIWIGPHFETKAQREQRLVRYREEDARADKIQQAHYHNHEVLLQYWMDKCPNGTDSTNPLCVNGPPTYFPRPYVPCGQPDLFH